MKIRNISIYHCLSCGHVARRELESVPPLCCRHRMVKAAEATVRELVFESDDADTLTKSLLSVNKYSMKPR